MGLGYVFKVRNEPIWAQLNLRVAKETAPAQGVQLRPFPAGAFAAAEAPDYRKGSGETKVPINPGVCRFKNSGQKRGPIAVGDCAEAEVFTSGSHQMYSQFLALPLVPEWTNWPIGC